MYILYTYVYVSKKKHNTAFSAEACACNNALEGNNTESKNSRNKRVTDEGSTSR